MFRESGPEMHEVMGKNTIAESAIERIRSKDGRERIADIQQSLDNLNQIKSAIESK